MRPGAIGRMLLLLLLLPALGCSQAGNVKQAQDSSSEDGTGQDATFDLRADSVDKETAGDWDPGDGNVGDVDAEDVTDVTPDIQQPGALVANWGLVSSGGTAVSTDHRLVWRVWEQLPPVRATSSNFNFFGGIVHLP